MRRILTILFVVILTAPLTLVLAVNLISAPASAQDKSVPSLTISPLTFDVNVEQNKNYSEQITLTNNAEIAVPIQTEVVDYSINDTGVPSYLADDTLWSSKSWIRVDPSTFILEPGGKRDIEFIIDIPEFAEPGSHFTAVLFKPVLPPEYFEDASTHVIPYIGTVIALNVNAERTSPLKNSVTILEFSSNIGDSVESRTFSANLENTDVFHHKVEGTVTISNMFGKLVDEVVIGDVTLFPKIKRIISTNSSKKLFPGPYTANLYVKGDQDEISSTQKFWVFPNVFTVLLFIVIAAAAYIFLKYRKNVRRAAKVMFTKV